MNEHARPPGWPRIKIYAAIAAFLVLVAAIGVPVYLAKYGTDQQDQKETAQAGEAAEKAEKKDLADQVKEACDAGGEAAKRLTAQGLCAKAKEIIQEPEKKVPVAKSITEAEVRLVVREEVDRRRLTLTPQQVATIATSAAALVPKPKDGKSPTTAQIQPLVSTAVATFCANDKCRGKDGSDAPPVTSDQLTATLRAYCSTRNDCIGRDGTNGDRGPQGFGVTVTTAPDADRDGTVVTVKSADPEVKDVVFFVANGVDGINGTNGDDAYPFKFTFVIPPSPPTQPTARTYACEITNPATPAECVEQTTAETR